MENDTPKQNPILVVQGLSCSRYDNVLFHGLSFRLLDGGLIQIEGENGSGKTTLLRTLCGFIEPEEGDILWNGKKIQDEAADYRGDLNYIGHNNGIKAGLTCIENLKLACSLSRKLISTDLDQVLDEYGLNGYQDSYTYSLSAGQRRRLALARLSLRGTKLWVLDEPFTSLDEKGKRLMMGIFKKHLNSGGMIIMTSHDLIKWEDIDPIRIGL
jgi:heme exporter protein A